MIQTNRTKGLILVSLLVIGVVLTGSTIILSALAANQGTTPDPQVPPRDLPWMTQLTDAQKQEIQQMVQSMKDSGATQQEIRDAVNAKLQGWGIQVPQDNGGQPRQPPWMSQLTDQQKQEIKQLMDSLTQSGATPQEIRDAVNAKLQEWGIEVPAPPQSSGQ